MRVPSLAVGTVGESTVLEAQGIPFQVLGKKKFAPKIRTLIFFFFPHLINIYFRALMME